MNNFDSIFAKAVMSLISEDSPKSKKQMKATEAIKWQPGRGRWNEIISSMKKEVSSYEEMIVNSAAYQAKPGGMLMAKLGIMRRSESDDDLMSTFQVLKQAIGGNASMNEAYEKPRISADMNSLTIVIKAKKSDLTDRNATAFIHLTLLGAYYAGMLRIKQPIKLQSGRTIVITKS